MLSRKLAKYLRKWGPSLNAFAVTRAKLLGRCVVYHHGLQRSGANYLLLCLRALGVPVGNAVDPAGNNPQHKHFRWYRQKSGIPNFIFDQYGNDVVVANLNELERVAQCSPRPRHIVIKKRKEDWLKSAMNWGIRCGWFAGKEDALQSHQELLRDYGFYYDFWEEIAREAPNRVRIVDFDELLAAPRMLLDVLVELDVPSVDRNFHGHFSSVPKSPVGRREEIGLDDIRLLLRK